MSFVYPFDEDNLIRVPVILEHGEKTLMVRALIDSGADSIFIDTTIGDYLGLLSMETLEVGAAGGSLNVGKVNLDRISLYSLDFKSSIQRNNMEAFVADDLGEEVVLGNSFFEGRCRLLFDYIKMELTIRD
ncbi:MAG: hypothetical protein GXO65_03365 [Euryarchaeota archaeon]|nr:hypothetical protein [Euryarchaeota archaeon]